MNPSEFLDVLDRLRVRLTSSKGRRPFSRGERISVRSVVGAWFSQYKPSFLQIVGEEGQFSLLDEKMQNLLKLTSEDAGRRAINSEVAAAARHFKESLLIPLSRAYWARAPQKTPAGRDEEVAVRLV